jgi:hypothetical protein
MHIVRRILVPLLPFLLTLLFAWLVAGPLSLGGGEKDIFLVIPLLLWSLIFAGCYLILWWRRSALGRSVVISAACATALVIVSVIFLAVAWQA